MNNAGVFYPRLLEETSEEMLEHTFDVNVLGPYILTQKTVLHMRSQGKGSIIFTGSIFGPVGSPYATSYAASKMAIHGLAMSLAIELAPTIRVNVVAPDNIDTPMNYPLYDALGGRPAFVADYPMGRLGLPSDIAAAVSFIASDEACWVTGTVLPVDGGYLAK